MVQIEYKHASLGFGIEIIYRLEINSCRNFFYCTILWDNQNFRNNFCAVRKSLGFLILRDNRFAKGHLEEKSYFYRTLFFH